MDRGESSDVGGVAERLVRVHEVLDLCIERRLHGEAVSDEQLIAEHPELLPELADELRGLAIIERARRSAVSRSRNGHARHKGGTGPAGGAPCAALVPGFEIVAPIHSGAQGVVYQARQRSTQRMVALKVMRAAAPDGWRELSRFEREVQILAALRHPNIVAIHDSGLTPDGRAYFVMDFIDGRPLDEWLAQQRSAAASSGERSSRTDRTVIDVFLRVFATICDAVHAAHLRGVIHRDIKPANIHIDTEGHPHVLDFGLAKYAALPDPAMTVPGQFIGSLPWASPEQAEGAIERIDVRTDVYALGVVLFGGLTGRFPYETTGPMREVLERIITAEPRRPSSFAMTSGLRSAIEDDLDTITLKCLSKEPERRYQSAGELARDVRAYLSGDPIEARRDSAFYLLRKRMLRYRAVLAVGMAALVVISGLAAYAALQARESRERAAAERTARHTAEEATLEAEAAQQEAARSFEQASAARAAEMDQRRLSDREALRARAVTAFLVRTLGLADPDVTQSSDQTIRALLDRSGAEIDSAFADQPASEAMVRLVFGRAYAGMGELEAALPHLEAAFAIRREEDAHDRRDLYEVLWPYAQVLEDLGDERWREVWAELLRTNRIILVREVPSMAAVLEKAAGVLSEGGFNPVAIDSHREAIFSTFAASVAPTDARWLLLADWSALYGGNNAYKRRPKHACTMLRDALEIQRRFLPETNTRVVRTLGNLVDALIEDERYGEAERITREGIERTSTTLSDDHWYLTALRARLAASLIGQGRLDDSETILHDAMGRLEAELADVSRHRIYARSYAAWLADARGHASQANELRRDVACKLAGEFREGNRFDLLRCAVSAEARPALSVLDDLYNSLRSGSAGYLKIIDKTFEAQRELFADDDPRSSVLGDLYYRVARLRANVRGFDAATIRLFDESERLAQAATCLNPWKRACALFGVGLAHEAKKRFAEGEICARQALAIVEPQFGEKLGLAAALRSLLAACISGQGRHDEAEPIALRAFDELLGRWGASNQDTRIALERVATLYAAAGRPQDALPSMRRLARGHKIPWSLLRPAFAACYPDLASELEHLRLLPSRNPARIANAVDRVLQTRQAAFDISNPDALLYAIAAYDFAELHLMVTPSPAWTPLLHDFVSVESALFAPPRKQKAGRLWWYAVALVEGGAFREAEAAAREAYEITRHFDAVGARTHASRAVVLARALVGQGRATEALPLLEGAIDALATRMDNRYAVQFVAAVLEVNAALGRLAAVTVTLAPFLENALEHSNDANFLNQVASRIAAHDQLDSAIRILAMQLARRATEIRPDDSAHWHALIATAQAAGDDEAADQARQRLLTWPDPLDAR